MNEERKAIINGIAEPYSSIKTKCLSDSAHLTDDLGMDSLDRVEFLMDIEEHFKVELPEQEFDYCDTLHDVYNFVELWK